MKKLTFLLLAFTLLVSCRKEFASFQKSPNINYVTKKKPIETSLEIIQPKQPNITASAQASYVFTEPSEISRSEKSAVITQNLQINDDERRKKRKNVSKKEGTFIQKIFPNQTHNVKKVVKKRRKPVSFNSTIYTGFVILGIAILLALVSLSSLSLLFGVAAIIFLYLGFRKYFRKIQRRNIFR